MSHVHKLIRDAVETKLTGLASTGSNVFSNRLYALADADLPALRVFLDNESVDELSVHSPATQERRIDIVVECCAKSSSATLDDTCDQMQLEVEAAIYAGIAIAGKTYYPTLTGSQYDDAIGLTPVAIKRVQFSLTYYTAANAADALT